MSVGISSDTAEFAVNKVVSVVWAEISDFLVTKTA